MAYSELIKDFSRIREYMRQFYIYGFKTRDEFDDKSGRSYDNERRRLESWLGDYMSFRQDEAGKVSFISVDSQEILHNPLYQAFKAKSFTSNDIVLHFYLMDILTECEECTVSQIAEQISSVYAPAFDEGKTLDESTIRKKLKEYERLGIVKRKKQGQKLFYTKNESQVDLDAWKDAVSFFSELEPLGVIGSYILDRMDEEKTAFYYKHHYILHVLESEILYEVLDAISGDCTVKIQTFSRKKRRMMDYEIVPLKVLISTQNGRSYVFGKNLGDGNFNMYRLDNVKKAVRGTAVKEKESIKAAGARHMAYHWNTSAGRNAYLDHLELILRIDPRDLHILRRLEKEGKQGSIESLGDYRYRYTVDVYDAEEMLPWIRTFTGRILSLRCSNRNMEQKFYQDLDEMYRLYGMGDENGGDDDAV